MVSKSATKFTFLKTQLQTNGCYRQVLPVTSILL